MQALWASTEASVSRSEWVLPPTECTSSRAITLPRPRISPHNSSQFHGAFVTKPLKTRSLACLTSKLNTDIRKKLIKLCDDHYKQRSSLRVACHSSRLWSHQAI